MNKPNSCYGCEYMKIPNENEGRVFMYCTKTSEVVEQGKYRYSRHKDCPYDNEGRWLSHRK